MRPGNACASGALAGSARTPGTPTAPRGGVEAPPEGAAPGAPGRIRAGLRGAWSFLTRRRGNRVWDAVIRSTGVLGLVGIGLVLLAPRSGPLVGLGIYTMWVTGPLSPFFPIGLEPILMLFGRLYAPLLVAAIATLGGLYIEFLNYHLYGKLLSLNGARRFRESRAVRFLQRLFGRAPFFTVWVCAWTPLPFWGARVLATMSDYPIGRYLLAAALGRLPKFWFFAALGLYWGLSDALLLGIAGGTALLATGLWLIGRRRGARATRWEPGRRAPGQEVASRRPREAATA